MIPGTMISEAAKVAGRTMESYKENWGWEERKKNQEPRAARHEWVLVLNEDATEMQR